MRGTRYVVAADVPILEAAIDEAARVSSFDDATVAFLAPLDPLAWDRELLRRLFGFDYVWEVYVPAAKRRWGYYVLPILFGDRFVGRFEPRIDRPAGRVRVLAAWWEPGFDPATRRPASSTRCATRWRPTCDSAGPRASNGLPRLARERRLFGVRPRGS